jgi:hypothetical protein
MLNERKEKSLTRRSQKNKGHKEGCEEEKEETINIGRIRSRI